MTKVIDVAIGVILDGRRVLVARRKATDSLGGFWEFPGGKVETGETLEQALLRELVEELGLTVAIVEALRPFEHAYPQAIIRLSPFIVHIIAGEAQPLDSDEIRWIDVDQLDQFRFPPADDNLIADLQRRFRSSDPQ